MMLEVTMLNFINEIASSVFYEEEAATNTLSEDNGEVVSDEDE